MLRNEKLVFLCFVEVSCLDELLLSSLIRILDLFSVDYILVGLIGDRRFFNIELEMPIDGPSVSFVLSISPRVFDGTRSCEEPMFSIIFSNVLSSFRFFSRVNFDSDIISLPSLDYMLETSSSTFVFDLLFFRKGVGFSLIKGLLFGCFCLL